MEDAFASLQLPRTDVNNEEELPTLCLLVVADMDLPSASDLAEFALMNLSEGGTLVDGIIACGPFLSDDTLRQYLQPMSTIPSDSPVLVHAQEGLVTGCLSQLESIVCRIAWVPATQSDPATLFSQEEERRLTPNSRNIHKRHLPLAPGLACCGLGKKSARYSSPTKDKETIAELLDLAAPLADQLPSQQCDALRLERSAAIVVTTAAEEAYAPTDDNNDDDRILLHIQATNKDKESSSSPGAPPHYSSGILHPGSLKERGDYCLVYISVVSAATATTTAATTNTGKESSALHRWQVQKVDFMQVELPERCG